MKINDIILLLVQPSTTPPSVFLMDVKLPEESFFTVVAVLPDEERVLIQTSATSAYHAMIKVVDWIRYDNIQAKHIRSKS